MLPTRLFIENAKGYPVLSKKHQELLKYFIKIINKLHIIFTGKPKIYSCNNNSSSTNSGDGVTMETSGSGNSNSADVEIKTNTETQTQTQT